MSLFFIILPCSLAFVLTLALFAKSVFAKQAGCGLEASVTHTIKARTKLFVTSMLICGFNPRMTHYFLVHKSADVALETRLAAISLIPVLLQGARIFIAFVKFV